MWLLQAIKVERMCNVMPAYSTQNSENIINIFAVLLLISGRVRN